jgi:hypothetical protein
MNMSCLVFSTKLWASFLTLFHENESQHAHLNSTAGKGMGGGLT